MFTTTSSDTRFATCPNFISVHVPQVLRPNAISVHPDARPCRSGQRDRPSPSNGSQSSLICKPARRVGQQVRNPKANACLGELSIAAFDATGRVVYVKADAAAEFLPSLAEARTAVK